MNSNDRLKELIQKSFPARSLSSELEDRVMRLDPKKAHKRAVVVWSTATAIAASVAVVLIAMSAPKTALADEILRQAKNLHGHILNYRTDEKGVRTLVGEGWIEPGRMRFQSDSPTGMDLVIDMANHVAVSWMPRMRAFWFQEGNKPQELKYGSFILAGTTNDFVKMLAVKPASKPIVGRGYFHGKAADFVRVPRLDGQITVYADPTTHRIVGIHSRVTNSADSRSNVRVQFHPANKPGATLGPVVDIESIVDNKVANPDVFKPIFDIDGRKVDAYKWRDSIRERLSKPIANYDAVGGSVSIRDVTRNSNGDVFILITQTGAQTEKEVAPSELQDDTDGVYGHSSQFGRYWKSEGQWPGFSFDGHPVEAFWFPHVSGPTSDGPVRIGFRPVFGSSSRAEFFVTAPTSETPGLIPNYMPFMPTPLGASGVISQEKHDKAEYLMRVGGFKQAEAIWRELIVEDSEGMESEFPYPRYELGICLKHEEKYAEAMAELREAKRLAKTAGTGLGTAIDAQIREVRQLAHS